MPVWEAPGAAANVITYVPPVPLVNVNTSVPGPSIESVIAAVAVTPEAAYEKVPELAATGPLTGVMV